MQAYPTLQQDILGEQVRTLHVQARDTVIAAPLAWLLLSYMLWPVIAHETLFLWLGLRIVCDLAYAMEIILYHRRKPSPHEAQRWQAFHLFILLFGGLSWGLSLPILSPMPQQHELLLLLFLCGISGANIIIYAVQFSSCATLLLTLWLPVLLFMAQRNQQLDRSLALAGLLYMSVLISYGWRAAHMLNASITIRLENSRLAQALQKQGEALQQANDNLRENNGELHLALQRINELATHDELTGCYNRRYLFNLLEQEQQRSDRYLSPISLILLDLDHFKLVNDRHGHLTGDDVLRALVRICTQRVRQTDVVARYGGEEFVIVMPMTEEATALALAERLRQYIASQPLLAQPPLTVTLSAGVAQFRPGETAEQWLDRADKALYAAKAQGRDRVVASSSLSAPPWLEHAS